MIIFSINQSDNILSRKLTLPKMYVFVLERNEEVSWKWDKSQREIFQAQSHYFLFLVKAPTLKEARNILGQHVTFKFCPIVQEFEWTKEKALGVRYHKTTPGSDFSQIKAKLFPLTHSNGTGVPASREQIFCKLAIGDIDKEQDCRICFFLPTQVSYLMTNGQRLDENGVCVNVTNLAVEHGKKHKCQIKQMKLALDYIPRLT